MSRMEICEMWADELLQHLADNFDDPYNAEDYARAVKMLALKLFKDAELWLVPEGFCADCDYKRRYEK